MRNPFLFEAEGFENESQFEDSFESFEDEYEVEDEFEDESDYEFEDESDYQSEGDYEFEGAGDYEDEYESDYEDEIYGEIGRRVPMHNQPSRAIVRDHRSRVPVRNQPSRVAPRYQPSQVRVRDHRLGALPHYQPSRMLPRYQPSRVIVRDHRLQVPLRYQPSRVHRFNPRVRIPLRYQYSGFPPRYQTFQHQRPRRWRYPGTFPPPYPRFGNNFDPRFGNNSNAAPPAYNPAGDAAPPPVQNPTETISLLQSLLNQVLGLNLPVDGTMNVETRSAIRSFQNRKDSSANGTAGQPIASGSADAGINQPEPTSQTGDDKDKPQGEYDAFEFSDWEAPSRESWRGRLGMRPKPQYLRFLSLDNFGIGKAALTNYHNKMLDNLVRTVEPSWKTMQPIDLIRLVGHTDSTGQEKFNAGLGEMRARAVEEALKVKLRGFMNRVAIVVEPSQGETAPTASNSTQEGRARNRRVEIFITSGGIPPPPVPPKNPDLFPPRDWQPGPGIDTPGDDPYGFRKRKTIPTLSPGKSFKQWFFEQLKNHRVPKWLHNEIWNAFLGKDSGLVSRLLDTAGISGPAKNAFLGTARRLAETSTR